MSQYLFPRFISHVHSSLNYSETSIFFVSIIIKFQIIPKCNSLSFSLFINLLLLIFQQHILCQFSLTLIYNANLSSYLENILQIRNGKDSLFENTATHF